MALAKQFYSSFKSYNGWDYYLEIWVEGFDSAATEISIGAGGPVITYGTDEQDRFSAILSSKLELPFMVTNTTQDLFIKNIREQFNEQDVYIHLYRANSTDYSSVSPLWSGFVLMDLSASPDLFYPYPVTLTAVDGLSLLKEIDFAKSGSVGNYSDSDMYSNNGRFTYWIKEILLKSGASTTPTGSTQDYKFTTAINWFNSVMPTITQSTDPFYQTKCNTKMFYSKDANNNFTVVNCYDVLKNLLMHWGARIIYWKHIYYIVQIQEYNTGESGTYANPDNIDTRTYTKTGAFDSSSDNLGDSYWTRYNLLIDSTTGGIQKLAGSEFNYLPQVKRTEANFIDYGNKNYFGGLPFDITTGQTDVIYQDTISDPSVDGSMILILPLDVTIVQQYNGSLDMRLYFRLYITDGATTYYLRYKPTNNPKFYWESSTTVNLNANKTKWYSALDNTLGTQTKTGFHQQIDFKDISGSALTLTGDWDVYLDIDNWGTQAGSFYFYASVGGIGGQSTQVYEPSLTTIYWTNTLNQNYQTTLNPTVIGTSSQQTTGMTGTSFNYTQNNVVTYTSSFNQNPFEGKLLIISATAGSVYGTYVSKYTNTNDVEVVDFGDLIWGDTLLASSEGSLKVFNGSSFVKSNVTGTWGLGTLSGTNSFTEMLLSEYLFGQTKVIESPSMTLVIGETNKDQNDGSGSRPNYVNPIGRLRGYSATGTTPYYIFKSGSFHLLKDEIDYQGYQIVRNPVAVSTINDTIIGRDVLQDKTNKIGEKLPKTNTLINKLTQNNYITTVSATKSAFGNDIAVNGIFSSDTGWVKGTGWSISSNKAVFSPTGSASDIKQSTLTNALTYKITLSVSISAGGLSVKAGSSGNSTLLSASGTYDIFSTCSGSTNVIFEASAAFEGYIEKVVVAQQVPVTSININAIGTAVFKTNDVLNIANFDENEINEFTVSSDQGASDTSISVVSKLLTEDVLEGSIVLVNQNDLAAQYQNKTKGTVAGFDITATGISKSSINITGWLNSDTMSGAAVTNVPTALSVKNYVDGQAGLTENLQTVTNNGNTTTNNVMIGSSSAPSEKLEVVGKAIIRKSGSATAHGDTDLFVTDATASSSTAAIQILGGNAGFSNLQFSDTDYFSQGAIVYGHTDNFMVFKANAAEKMRLTSAGKLGIGTTSPSFSLDINSGTANSAFRVLSTDRFTGIRFEDSINNDTLFYDGQSNLMYLGSTNFRAVNLIATGTGSFTGQVTIPATPVASTDAASKGYVDAQVGASDTLQEVTDNGNTTTNSIMIGSSSSPALKLEVIGAYDATPVKFLRHATYGNIIRLGRNGVSETAHIGYPADATLNFSTGGSEKMRLTSGGNVGIGTTSPAYPLDIVGFANSSSGYRVTDGTIDNRVSWVSGNVGFFGTISNHSIGFFTNSTERARITSGGNVLIGTTSDFGDKLSVNGNLRFTTATLTGSGFIKNESGYIGITTVGNKDIVLDPDGTGNVLINTTTDNGYNLDVNGSARIDGILYYNGNLKSVSPDKLIIFNNSDKTEIHSAGATGILFKNNFDTERARITSGGNLLIGTTTDDGSSKLQVAGNLKITSTDPNLIIEDTNGRSVEIDVVGNTFRIDDIANNSPIFTTNLASNPTTTTFTTVSTFTSQVTIPATPVASTDAASKGYVDAHGGGLGPFLPLTGGTLTGSLTGTTATFSGNLELSNGTLNSTTARLSLKSEGSYVHLKSNNNVIYYDATSHLFRDNSGSEKMRLTTNGLLIGTTTDSGEKLQVNGTVAIGTNLDGVKIRLTGTVGEILGLSTTSGSYNDLDIRSQAGTQLYLKDNGNTGILTSSPNEALEVNGAVAIGNNIDGVKIRLTGTKGEILGLSTTSGSYNDLDIRAQSGTQLYLKDTGNVGIGTSSPSGKLHITNGTNAINTGANADRWAFTGATFNYIQSAGQILIQPVGDLVLNSAGSETMRLKNTNVLIGTTSDSGFKLRVNGDSTNGVVAFKNASNARDTIRSENAAGTRTFNVGNDGSGHGILLLRNSSGTTTSYLSGSGVSYFNGGNVIVGGTTDSGVYKFDVVGKARVQSVFELDDVLTLNQISTPADPASGQSSIYMDSADGAIKVKINVGGTVVTRTIASFE